MVAGLIVLQPYADQIISGKKQEEYRSKPPPKHYINTDIYLLSKGVVLGKIRVIAYYKIQDHYVWTLFVMEEYTDRKKYIHPNGAQVWVKEVLFGKVTMDDFK